MVIKRKVYFQENKEKKPPKSKMKKKKKRVTMTKKWHQSENTAFGFF